MNESKSKTTKDEVKEEKSQAKGQKVKILTSIYRYNDRIISSLGIPTRDAWVSHILPKKLLKPEELFNISQALSNGSPYRKENEYKSSLAELLNAKSENIILPSRKANVLTNIGKLIHEIINVEIELFLK